MAQPITSIFPNAEDSARAEAQLRSEGYSVDRRPAQLPDLPAMGTPAEADEALWQVIVSAPFGTAARAIDILCANGATEVHEHVPRSARRSNAHRSAGGSAGRMDGGRSGDDRSDDQSFFVSSALGLPLLIDNPAPLSSLLGLPILVHEDGD